MGHPWGIAGPDFLRWYWIALAACLVFALVVRTRMRTARQGEPGRPLDLDEVAHLAGGPRRVVEVSVARLVEAGALRPSRRGTVQATGMPAVNPVDQAVLADAGRHRHRTVTLLVNTVSRSPAVLGVAHRLVSVGMLVDPAASRARRRLAAAPLLVLLAVGVARWLNGVTIAAPVGWLTLQLILTAVIAVVLLKAPGVQRTARGDEALDQTRTGGHAALWGGAAGLVALGGLVAFPDATVRAALLPPPSVSTSDSWTSGSSCSASSSSSCSSGSSCGSSCGGGGGCGGG
jgi:uncharacterized protein (TIGR04222 family)